MIDSWVLLISCWREYGSKCLFFLPVQDGSTCIQGAWMFQWAEAETYWPFNLCRWCSPLFHGLAEEMCWFPGSTFICFIKTSARQHILMDKSVLYEHFLWHCWLWLTLVPHVCGWYLDHWMKRILVGRWRLWRGQSDWCKNDWARNPYTRAKTFERS